MRGWLFAVSPVSEVNTNQGSAACPLTFSYFISKLTHFTLFIDVTSINYAECVMAWAMDNIY